MKNYCIDWKKRVNFNEMTHSNFIEDYSNISNSFYIQKIDGMLCMLIYEKDKECFFQTTTGAIIKDIPVLKEYKESLSRFDNIKSIKIAGELVARKGNRILDWGDSQSIIKTYTRSNTNLIFHYCYDIYELNGQKISFKEAINYLKFRLESKEFKHIVVPEYTFNGINTFKNIYRKFVGNKTSGIEGIVVRSERKNFKIKPSQTLDLVVMGAGNKEMISWNRKQISFLLPAFMDKDKNFRLVSKIGTGFDFKTREYFYDYVIKNKTNEDTYGNTFVKPELVIEVKFLRYHINEMDTFEYKNGVYTKIGKKKSVTLINPRFTRIRDDKKINEFDVRIEQIPEFG